MHDSFEKKMRPLEDLADALAEAKRAKELLDEIWSWYGPYGPDLPYDYISKTRTNPEMRKLLEALQMPEKLRYKLQDFFRFDDSE
jgi:hypothetical protein